MATIRKRGDKYQVQIRRKGHTALSRSFNQRKDAQAWARMMEVKADRRELPTDAKTLGQTTLRELVERYRDEISPKHKGKEIERIVLDAFLRHPICNHTLASLSPQDFAAYRDQRLKEIKPSTLRRQLSLIAHMFTIARREWGLTIENPLADVHLPNPDNRRDRRLREGEYEALIRAAQEARQKMIVPIIKLAVETGMRRGEILNIRFRDIDPSEPSLTIPETKNGHKRVIPLSRVALAILEAQRKPETNSRDRAFSLTSNAVRRSFERIREKAGLDDLHFHDFRHEAISRLFELGLTVPEVALVSGHRTLTQLSRYSHAQRQIIAQKLKVI